MSEWRKSLEEKAKREKEAEEMKCPYCGSVFNFKEQRIPAFAYMTMARCPKCDKVVKIKETRK